VRILVTLDGSQFSEAILKSVANVAGPLGADVELLSVGRPSEAHVTPSRSTYTEMTPAATATGTRINVPLPSDQQAHSAETRQQALDRMEAELYDYLNARAHDLGGVTVETRVEFADDVAGAIIERARATHPDLIAMATHGRTGLSHLLAGSVCERVIRSGVAPVLVLRP
jgi:nucleotide-binding universal stress UspA family protein